MILPSWVRDALTVFEAPPTGKVVIELELYQGGVTKLEIGGIVRHKPPQGKE